MLYVDYGKQNLFGWFDCKNSVGGVTRCNVYRCNGLLAWVARQYADDKKEFINTNLWGFFNDIKHVNNALGLVKGYDNYIINYIKTMFIVKSAPKKVISACEKISRVCCIDLKLVDELDEFIYPYEKGGEE